ncbi:MAG: hypothetical protein MK358_06885, partial [Vicinamibacterales bacterium]|nr:hypothetical protein [Vicinamibacterales bacterium]
MGIENLEGDRVVSLAGQVVVKDGTVGRVLAGGLIGRGSRIWVLEPAKSPDQLRLKQVRDAR